MRIGPLHIDRGVLLAPMEDITDQPFRLLCKRLGADIVYTEFVKSEELLQGGGRATGKLRFRDAERPIGIQIYGGEPDTMGEAARRAAACGPDLIDINCGCWVKDVTRHGAGADLLRDLPRMERIAAAVVRAVDIPVTLKTRLGWDAASIQIVDVARMCEAVGIGALTVHCRTRDQGHTGRVDYEWIPRLKAAVSIPIIVNGDVRTAADVERLFAETGCDAVMIGRGAIRNPWIFQQSRARLDGGTPPPEPGPAERLAVFREHFRLAVECLGEAAAVRELRRHYATLLHGLPHVGPIRDELRRLGDPVAILEHLARHLDLYTATAGTNVEAPAATRLVAPTPPG